jgi:hypothetical protein
LPTEKLFKQAFQYKETSCNIIADNEKGIKTAILSIKQNRIELDGYVRKNPRFLYSLSPVSVTEGPEVAKKMAEAAEKANVGPMAAVAGVLADLAVRDMILDGNEVAVVENGGEISAVSNRPIDVALLAGDSPMSGRFGFRLKDFPIGIATSSGLYSHALSFGEAEAVTIFSTNAGIADAAATAIGNVIKGKNYRVVIKRGIRKAFSIHGVEGVLVLYKGMVGKAGRIPQIIKLNTSENTTPYLEALKSIRNFFI